MSQEKIIVLGHKHFVGGISAAAFETNIKNWKAIRARCAVDSTEYRYVTQRIAKVTQMLHELKRKYLT